VGCAPDGPAKYFWVLGRSCFETFLRSACLEWLYQTPSSHAGYLGVSTLHTIKINIVSPTSSSIDYQHYNFSYDPSTISSFDAPFKTLLGILGYWASLFEASSRSARLQGVHEVGPARLLAVMLGDLGVSTLRSIKAMTQFSSLFGASNQPCCLLQCSGTTLRVHLRRPLVFLVVPTCWDICFSSRRYSTHFFSSIFWTIIPVILPAMMLGYYS
jgi:hypothetical protein